MTYFDLGLIDGNSFGAAQLDLIEAALNKGVLAAEVRLYVGTVQPTGWLFLNGQVVVNFQGLYPDAWAAIPAAWKSGSNANLPNMAARFPIGQDGGHVLGAAGGANTHTLATVNLPSHLHAIDHNHAVATSTIESNDHHHQVDTTAFAASGGGVVVQTLPGPHAVYDVGDTSTGATIFTTNAFMTFGAEDISNTHFVQHHTHDLDLPNFVGSSGLTGSGTAVDHTPAWVAFNFILKVH